MQHAQALQVIGQLGAMRGLTHRKRVARGVVRVAQMVHAGQHGPEHLAVGRHATDRQAAEVHTVVATFTAYQARAMTLAAHAVIGQGHLQRSVDCLGARVGEEELRHARRGELDSFLRELECLGMRHLKRRREIHLPLDPGSL